MFSDLAKKVAKYLCQTQQICKTVLPEFFHHWHLIKYSQICLKVAKFFTKLCKTVLQDPPTPLISEKNNLSLAKKVAKFCQTQQCCNTVLPDFPPL